MIKTWEDLKYWESGEFQVVEERLDDILKAGGAICPSKENLFNALYATPFEKCKVLLMGQDPYPNPKHACGLSFSVPKQIKVLPPTLKVIFDEYESDLHLSRPMNGDLHDWAKEGVLLWNAVPSCLSGHSLSHDWPEWRLLTDEIVSELAGRGIVFVLIGNRARGYATKVRGFNNCKVIEVAHPSPMANRFAHQPFKGSRIFTHINAALLEIGLDPVDWRLLCRPTLEKSKEKRSNVVLPFKATRRRVTQEATD